MVRTNRPFCSGKDICDQAYSLIVCACVGFGRSENLGQTHSGAAAGKSKHGAGQYTLEIRGILLPVRNQRTQPCRLAVIEAWPSPRASVLSALIFLCTCVACLLGSG